MDLSSCKEYYFRKGELASKVSGKTYGFQMEKYDRFYMYIKPYISAEKVSKTIKERMDVLIITDLDNTFFDEDILSLNTSMCVTDLNNVVCTYDIVLKNIRIKYAKNCEQSYKNGIWTLKLYEMELTENTEIEITERKN